MSASAYRARRYRARVTPRGGGRSRIRWDRFGRIVLVLVLFAVLASYVNPLVNLVDSWRDSRAERQRLDQVRSQNRALRNRFERLSHGKAGRQKHAGTAPAASGGSAVEVTPSPATDAATPSDASSGSAAAPSATSGAATAAEPQPAPAPTPGADSQAGATTPPASGGVAPG